MPWLPTGGLEGVTFGELYSWVPPGDVFLFCRFFLVDVMVQVLNILNVLRRRPYRVECTGSLPTSEVKRRRARLVLGWGTAREDLRVLPAFSIANSL